MTTIMKAGAKDLQYLMGRLKRSGHRVEMRGSGHYMVKHRDGIGLVTLSATPSDRRAVHNVRSQLRRAGFGDDI
jgi:hypothetical protein